ncbi:MAG: hypothetical protein HY000_11885, partial [Planctomycetes bacterium]|nr:hypothetical protein [Planctomycetota bacterium]
VVWRSFLQPVRLLDFWWHLKAGEVIVSSGSIPRTNIFSFTASAPATVPHCWLSEAIYYLVYWVGGLPLLIVLNTALLVAALLPVYHLCVEECARRRLVILAAVLPAGSLALFSGMRPHVFSFMLLAVFYWVLAGFRRRRRDVLWVLPPLMALWVNLHGAFVIGLGLIVLFLGCESVRRLVHGPVPGILSLSEFAKLALILAACVLATLLNPEYYRVYSFVLEFGVNKYTFVTEWEVPRVNSMEGILTFHGAFFLTLLVLLVSRERLDLTELALFLGFAAFGLAAYRNGVWFPLIAAPIVSRRLPSLEGPELLKNLERFAPVRSLRRWVQHLFVSQATPSRSGLDIAFAALLLGVTVILSPWVYPRLGIGWQHNGLLERETPVGAMDYIEQHNLAGNIFHHQIYGDYLIWRLWPRHRSLFDSQVHFYGQPFFDDYASAFHDSHWEERLVSYDIAFLLLRNHAAEDQRIADAARQSSGWRLLFEDELSVLFGRVQ